MEHEKFDGRGCAAPEVIHSAGCHQLDRNTIHSEGHFECERRFAGNKVVRAKDGPAH